MICYFSNRLIFDYLIACALSIFTCFLHPNAVSLFTWPASERFSEIMMVTMQTAAGILGFVLAACTFLVNHVQSERFRVLVDAGGWKQFPMLIRSTLWRLIILIILSSMAAFSSIDLLRLWACLVLLVVVLNVMALAALIWVTSEILKI